jgi:hypothetical protein
VSPAELSDIRSPSLSGTSYPALKASAGKEKFFSAKGFSLANRSPGAGKWLGALSMSKPAQRCL